LSDPSPFRFGDLELSEDKIALVRSDQPATSVRRSAITGVRVKNGTVSEHPVREFLWGTALFMGGGGSLAHELASGSPTSSLVLPALLLGLGVWFFVHLLRGVPQLQVAGPNGAMRFRLRKGTNGADMAALRSKLKELGYPVDPTDG
jgi:hypothetical protein